MEGRVEVLTSVNQLSLNWTQLTPGSWRTAQANVQLGGYVKTFVSTIKSTLISKGKAGEMDLTDDYPRFHDP